MSKLNKKLAVLDGIMTYSKQESGLLAGDFKNFESDVELPEVSGKFKCHLMRDGNLYMRQLPPRIRNKPKFRQDHSSVSIGRNGKGYFVMVVDEKDLKSFPQILLHEAYEAAKKMTAKRNWANVEA